MDEILQNMLETNESSIDLKSSTKEIYNEAVSILEKLEQKNPEKYQKALSEYKQLKEKIISSLEDDNKITKEELLALKLELNDLKNIDSSYFEKIKNSYDKDNFKNKNINDYSTIEARIALEYLNSNYNSYSDGTVAGFNENSINELKDKKDVNVFQERLIEKIIGDEKGYNNEYIIGFNNERGNFLLEKNEIEASLQNDNFQSMNRLVLKNYFNNLDEKNEFEEEKLVEKFGEDKTKEILTFIERQNDFNSDNFFDKTRDFLNKIKNKIEKIANEFLDKITESSSVEEFKDNLKEINNQDKDTKEKILEKLEDEIEKDKEKFKKLFLQALREKGIEENEANDIVDELVKNISDSLKNGELGEVFKEIDTFNKKYEANIDTKETVALQSEIIYSETNAETIKINIELEEALQKGDKERIKKLTDKKTKQELTIRNLELNKKVLENISEEQIKDIVSGKTDYNKVLEELSKKDSSLEKLLKNIEKTKEKIKQEEKANKEKNENDEDNKESNEIVEKANIKSDKIKEVNYDEKSSILKYQIEGKEVNLSLNSKDQEIIKNNPENIENIINFYDTLQKVGLDELWKIKENIFNSISNKNGIGFNIEGDYLNENETQIFLNSILKSVGEKTIEGVRNIDEFIAKMEIKNGTQMSGEEKKVNIHGDTSIEEKFITKFFPRGSLNFNTSLFENSL